MVEITEGLNQAREVLRLFLFYLLDHGGGHVLHQHGAYLVHPVLDSFDLLDLDGFIVMSLTVDNCLFLEGILVEATNVLLLG